LPRPSLTPWTPPHRAALLLHAASALRRVRAAGLLAPPHPRHLGTIHPGRAWQHAYGGQRPDLGRALEFYDRWLPGTMRRVAAITRTCVPPCVMLRRSW
jgi:hypothetical protein